MKLLGGHVSITGGVHLAPQRAREATCDSMQIFSKNQMQWKAKSLAEEDAAAFKRNLEEHGIQEPIIHDSYLINLCSPDKDLLMKSREAFLDEVRRAELLGIRHLIFHPGAHMGAGEKPGLKKIAESLNWVRKESGTSRVQFVLEITAGQGTVMGRSFEQLAKIIDMLDQPKLAGVCFDTCHAYAAGYDIKSESGYKKTFATFEDVLGVDRMRAMHLNDSKGKLGSHLDRHEQIGKGFLGLDCFKHFMNDDRWAGIPMELETPEGEKGYKQELKSLRGLIED